MTKKKPEAEKPVEPFPGYTPPSMPVIVSGPQSSTTHPDIRER